MFGKKLREERLVKRLEKVYYVLSKNNIIELADLLENSKKFVIKNFWAGILKGIGAGIGFTILTAILVVILQKIVTLNIPVIGDYIADIISIVERNI